MLTVSLYQKKDFNNFRRYVWKAFRPNYVLAESRYLNWQYNNSLFLLKDRKQIIGHFGFRDLPYKIYKQSKKVRVLINLFVLSEYRTFGLGDLLIKKVFNTSNPLFVSGYRVGAMKVFKHYCRWQEGNLKRFMTARRELPDRKIQQDINESKETKTFIMTKFSKKAIDDLWKKIRHRYPVSIERNFEYLSWRFFKHPFLKYSVIAAKSKRDLTGLLIWRIDGQGKFKTARIIDFVADDKSKLPLLFHFSEEMKKKKINVADFLFSGKSYKQALMEAGFFNIEGSEFENYPLLLSPVSHKKSKINIAYNFPADFNDCYFTKADGDQDRPNPI